MDIHRFGPDDTDRLQGYVDVVDAARAVDSPWRLPDTLTGAANRFRFGWDGEVETPYVGLSDGVPVAVGTVATSDYDNLHLAWLGVQVHPHHRRRGHGSALLTALVDESRARARTSVGIDGWESEACRGFAARHGFELRSVAVERRQSVGELDWAAVERLHEEAVAAASAYDVVRREGRTPDAELESLAQMAGAINDAPTDELDIEDEV